MDGKVPKGLFVEEVSTITTFRKFFLSRVIPAHSGTTFVNCTRRSPAFLSEVHAMGVQFHSPKPPPLRIFPICGFKPMIPGPLQMIKTVLGIGLID